MFQLLGECHCWWTSEHMKPSSTVDFGWFVAFESIKIVRVKIVLVEVSLYIL